MKVIHWPLNSLLDVQRISIRIQVDADMFQVITHQSSKLIVE